MVTVMRSLSAPMALGISGKVAILTKKAGGRRRAAKVPFG